MTENLKSPDAGLVADALACIAMADEIAKCGRDVLPGRDADDADADMSVLTTPLGELALDASLCAANSAAMMERLLEALSTPPQAPSLDDEPSLRRITEGEAALDIYERALRGIAANTCCDTCREAALVARHALSSAKSGRGDQLIA